MKRERTYSWKNPILGASKALTLSGFDYLKAMAEGEVPMPPIMQTLDFNANTMNKGKISFTIQPQEFHYNPIGCVHGGVVSTVLDTVMGCAVHSHLPAGFGYSTLELKINFLRQVKVDSGILTAWGSVIHHGKQTAVAKAELMDESGKLFAHGSCTCLIMKFDQS